MPTISHLPVEIVAIIFRLLYEDATVEIPSSKFDEQVLKVEAEDTEERVAARVWIEDKTLDTSFLFPYSVSSVCRRWRIILAAYPEYWTRLIFDDDTKPPLPVDACRWSRALRPLDIFVIDRSNGPKTCAQIVEALAPHIHRCRTLSYKVTSVSSLPPISAILGESLHPQSLISVVLICTQERVIRQLDVPAFDRLETTFPNLTDLSLPGHTFMEIGRMQPDWLENLIPAANFSLTISNYRFTNHKHSSLSTFCHYISKFTRFGSMCFRRLCLAYLPQAKPEGLKFEANRLTFISINKIFIHHFLEMTETSLQGIIFVHCTVPKISQNISCPLLGLVHIEDDDSLRNALPFSSSCVFLKSCPTFNDDFLALLAAGEREGERILNPSVARLGISDCPDFDPSLLIEFIDARNAAAANINNLEELHPLIELSAWGTLPALTDDHLKWFQNNAEILHLEWGA